MATYTVANGGGNINAAATYVGGVGVPGAADTIVFTTTSGQLTINVATTILDFDLTNYGSTLTFTNNLTVTRNIIFGGGSGIYSVVGSGSLVKNGTGSLTSNLRVWPGKLTFAGSLYTVTFLDKLTVSGEVIFSNTSTLTFSPNNILDPARLDITGNLTVNGSGTLVPTATNGFAITFNGTGTQTWDGGSSTLQIKTDIIINKSSGTLNFSGNIYYNTGIFTHTLGATNTGTSTLFISAASTTLNTKGSSSSGATVNNSNGINWYNCSLGATTTLTSDMCVINNLIGANATISRTATENIYLGGSLTMTSTLNSTSVVLVMNGTGTWSGSAAVTMPLTINTLGTITISGNVAFDTRTLTYTTAGSMVVTGSTLTIGASCTLDTNGMSWNNITIAWGGGSPSAVSITVTLSSNLSLLGNLTLNGNAFPANMTFAGSGNISCSGNLAINQLYNGGSVTLSLTLTNTLNATNLTTSAPNTIQYFTLNGGTMNLSGGITLGNLYAGIIGTTNINLIGTGTINCGSGVSISVIRNNLTINTLGTITLGGTLLYNTGTLTYIQGTMVYNSNILNIANSYNQTGAISCSLSGNANWFSLNIAPSTSATVTLLSDIGTQNLVTSTNSVTINGLFNINVSGNITINTTTSGTSNILINGNSSQSWTGTANYLSNPVNINKSSGTLTLGSLLYYNGTLTYISGNVDSTTNNNTLYTTAANFNTSGISLNNVYFLSAGGNVFTISSDLVMSGTFTCGGNGSITGAFNLYCGSFALNNSSSGAGTVVLTYSGTIYCSNDATFSGPTNTCTMTGDLYVGGSCYHNAPASATQGAANLYMVGNGELRAPSTAGTFVSNLYFNTSGKITITGYLSYALGAARTINLIRGNVDARKATLTLNRAFTHALTNMNKIVWGNVVLDTVSAIGLNMNEFFCGDATTQTNITTNNAAINATVTFTDNFEKIAKFVNMNGVTFARPQQLLLITNQPKKSRNIGIRYGNSLANGISKGDSSIQNQQTVGQSRTLLLGDPAFVKSI